MQYFFVPNFILFIDNWICFNLSGFLIHLMYFHLLSQWKNLKSAANQKKTIILVI